MPELPEVETVVRDLRPQTEGRRISAVPHAGAMVQMEFGPLESSLVGRKFVTIERHGKWMFFRLSDGNTLVIHLGMTGRLLVVSANEPVAVHTHLRLALDKGREELRFIDARRFGELIHCGPESWEKRFGADQLGIEATTLTLAQLRAVLGKTKRRLKAVLLDQRAVAGIGNIYADEILFEAGLLPYRTGESVTEGESRRLHRSVGKVLAKAIKHNGTSFRDYVTGHGAPGGFQRMLKVYGRGGEECKKCGSEIELSREIVTGRATCWCRTCQK